MKLRILPALAACTLGLTGCLDGGANTCSQTVTEPATNVTGPKTVAVNQDAIFTIDYPIESSCGKSNGALDQAQGNTHYIGVQVVYDGCNCPQIVTAKQATYTFKPTQAGTYFLKFTAANNAFITDTLVAK